MCLPRLAELVERLAELVHLFDRVKQRHRHQPVLGRRVVIRGARRLQGDVLVVMASLLVAVDRLHEQTMSQRAEEILLLQSRNVQPPDGDFREAHAALPDLLRHASFVVACPETTGRVADSDSESLLRGQKRSRLELGLILTRYSFSFGFSQLAICRHFFCPCHASSSRKRCAHTHLGWMSLSILCTISYCLSTYESVSTRRHAVVDR
jgi:hypothetical protein